MDFGLFADCVVVGFGLGVGLGLVLVSVLLIAFFMDKVNVK